MSLFIFNQYYIEFLRKIKNACKDLKEDENAIRIMTTIKEKYQTLDKSSDIYVNYLKSNIKDEVWDKLVENKEEWIKENKDIYIYEDIKLEDIEYIIKDSYLIYHFISVFYIFMEDLDEETSKKIVKIMQSLDSKDIESLENEKIRNVINGVKEMRYKKVKSATGFNMNGIEDTTLGKLAKEILEDIDVEKIQKSMGEEGDILKAIGDPDSGFADIIASVSKKMATKISNGELKQENLIQDALKFASIMPNMFNQGNQDKKEGENDGEKMQMPDMSNIMEMMSSLMGNKGNQGDKKDMPDMANMMDMMSSLMGNKGKGNNVNELFKNMDKKKGHKPIFNENAFKRMEKVKKLKNKLKEKNSK